MNRARREGVGKTLEWATLDMAQMDTPGFMWYLLKHHKCRPSLQDRVESELKSFTVRRASSGLGESIKDKKNRG